MLAYGSLHSKKEGMWFKFSAEPENLNHPLLFLERSEPYAPLLSCPKKNGYKNY
jgi:hypothetical protein